MMNKITASLGIAFFVLTVSQVSLAAAPDLAELQLSQLPTQALVSDVSPLDLIKWKVGDTMDYDVGFAAFGKIGTMHKAVTKDEGAAIWVQQQMALMGQNENIEILINKADGKVIRIIRNGQEQQIPDDKIEIISQEYTQITVPAGTFDVLHVVAKTTQVKKLELWANPPKTVMDGVVKQNISANFGEIAMELTSFKKGQ